MQFKYHATLFLIPTTPVTVRQGQEAKVLCESEGVSVTKLIWKRQTTKGDVTVPDNMVTVDKDRSNNRVRATLTITNVQPQDGGVYKCVLMVFDKTDYHQTTVLVKGILNRPWTLGANLGEVGWVFKPPPLREMQKNNS